MSDLYHWQGPERFICSGCTACDLTIESFSGECPPFSAAGTVRGRDFIECVALYGGPWEARFEQTTDWSVWRKESKDPYTPKIGGLPSFTSNAQIDDALLAFITEQLELFQDGHDPTLPEFSGPRHEYDGNCICSTANDTLQQQWKKLTNGGQFPERCFACSCGTKWYSYAGDERWFVVQDEKAWEMLLKHNGQAREAIVFSEQRSGLADGIHLAETAREHGHPLLF